MTTLGLVYTLYKRLDYFNLFWLPELHRTIATQMPKLGQNLQCKKGQVGGSSAKPAAANEAHVQSHDPSRLCMSITIARRHYPNWAPPYPVPPLYHYITLHPNSPANNSLFC